MDSFALRVFQGEVALQCQFAIKAMDDLRQALTDLSAEPDEPTPREQPDVSRLSFAQASEVSRRWAMQEFYRLDNSALRVFSALQAFLTAAANVSKLLWPVAADTPNFPDRGEALRDSLGVRQSSPLQSRTLRNHFEHFDARLDDYLSDTSTTFDLGIGSPQQIHGLPDRAIYRNFDPETWSVWFQGDFFELQPLISALEALGSVAQEKPFRLR